MRFKKLSLLGLIVLMSACAKSPAETEVGGRTWGPFVVQDLITKKCISIEGTGHSTSFLVVKCPDGIR